jgi:hypothetical protein
MRVLRSEQVGRFRAMIAIALCLLGLVAAGCRASPPAAEPTSAPPSPSPIPPSTTRVPTPTPLPTATPLPPSHFASTPGSALTPLSDADAVARMEEAALRYGAVADTVKVFIAGEPRTVTVRYTSPLSTEQGTFDLQRTLSTMAIARIVVRLDPVPAGGLSVAIIPSRDADVGLLLTIIDGDTLARWTRGELNDAEFIRHWEMGAMTRQ